MNFVSSDQRPKLKNTGKFLKRMILPVLLTLACMVACEDDSPHLPYQDNQPAKGVVRPTGNPTGTLQTQEVGPEGGEVISADGMVTISIPAGALSETVTIGLQEIENTNVAGIGKGMRLTPHGQQFKKPVAISFSYAGHEREISSVYVLGVAFQDEAGIWNYVAGPVTDEEKKTVTVQSTHFSDWGIMQWMHILPPEANVEVSGKVELKAVRFLPVEKNLDELLTPLVPPEGWVPVGEYTDLEYEYTGRWSLAGLGILESGGNTATFFAPPQLLDEGQVMVSMQLSSEEEQIILVSNITVLGNGIEFRIDGGEWIKMDGMMVESGPNHYAIPSHSGGATFSISWTGGVGNHLYTKDLENDTYFGYWPAGFATSYICRYDSEKDYGVVSGGGINITSMGEEDGWATGTFSVNPAGVKSGGKQVGLVSIEGRFRVRTRW